MPRLPKTPKKSAAPEISVEERIVHHLNGLHAAANGIAEVLKQHLDLALASPEAAKQDTQTLPLDLAPVMNRLAALEERLKALETRGSGSDEPIARKARKPKEEPKSEVAICKHLSFEKLSRPGLGRCTDCNAIIDIPTENATTAPPPVAQTAVPPPVAPTPTPAPAAPALTVEDVRSAAIGFIGRHGKERFQEILKKYGAPNISAVPEGQRAALYAEIQ